MTTGITEAAKLALFEKMLDLEHKGELFSQGRTYDGVNYCWMSDGAYEMLRVLGLDSEYIEWAYQK